MNVDMEKRYLNEEGFYINDKNVPVKELNDKNYFVEKISNNKDRSYFQLKEGIPQYSSPPGIMPPKLFKLGKSSSDKLSSLCREIWELPEGFEFQNIHKIKNNFQKCKSIEGWDDGRIDFYWQQLSKNGDFKLRQKFLDVTQNVCREFVTALSITEGTDKCYCQSIFSPRIIQPKSKVVGFHKDFRLPYSAKNFIVFMTPALGSNSLWLECDNKSYKAVNIPNDGNTWVLMFDAKETFHGGFINTTNVTRLSFDCRVLPEKNLDITNIKKSYLGSKFVPGDAFFVDSIEPSINSNIKLVNALSVYN